MRCKGFTVMSVFLVSEEFFKSPRDGVVQYYCIDSSLFMKKQELILLIKHKLQMSYSHLVERTFKLWLPNM